MNKLSEGLDHESIQQTRLANKFLRGERVCTLCGTMKPLGEFYSGHQCKMCLRQKQTPAEAVNNVFDLVYNNKHILSIMDADKCLWYKAKDVCDVMDYVKPDQAIRKHVDVVDKTTARK